MLLRRYSSPEPVFSSRGCPMELSELLESALRIVCVSRDDRALRIREDFVDRRESLELVESVLGGS